jgi:CheY-like chemotaxis protein
MEGKQVLIVDDEKNIRLTLSLALEPLGLEVDTAVNGEEALAKLAEKEFAMILLDLRMPGMDGIGVLREVRRMRPDIPVIMISAYGTIESAVEAMKGGAADFIRKPFVPNDIRDLVSRVLLRGKSVEQRSDDYGSTLALARKSIEARHFETAMEHVRRAVSLDPGRPEAFNLLGVIQEIRWDRFNAQLNYRIALSMDPGYEPAGRNLHRSTSRKPTGGLDLGDKMEEDKEKGGKEDRVAASVE